VSKTSLAVHFSSETDNWATPKDFFEEMDRKYGPLTLDVCASPTNRKCFAWFGLGPDGSFTDGLAHDWNVDHGGKGVTGCWMNPPYGREIGKWVKKAYDESKKGCLVVALLPARTDTRWFHSYIYGKAEIVFVKGRLKFGDAKNSAPFPSMVVIFRPNTIDENTR
jgi:phage N-6-adenine-methyltransferase